jgi:nucleotide-binding universal stress UspA family protein
MSLARGAGAELSLLMVHEPSMARVPVADLPMDARGDELERRVTEQTYLADTAHRLGPLRAGPVKCRLIDGLATDAIADVVTTSAADLIVMSTHGRGALSRFWLGSVVDGLIRRVSVPLLLFRPSDGAEHPGKPLEIRRILVALDLSTDSERILDVVKPIAQIAEAHITLLHVVDAANWAPGSLPYPIPVQPEPLEAAQTEAQRSLDHVADRLRAEGFRVAARAQIGASPMASILSELEQDRFDLMALTTHGAGGFRRFMLGSVADKVVRGATKPVLIYRPPERPSGKAVSP